MEPFDICLCQHHLSHPWTHLTTEQTQTQHLLFPKQVGVSLSLANKISALYLFHSNDSIFSP